MANGLDRLERFFTKRKPSAAAIESSEPANPPAAPNTEPQFPSPSFIRPRTSRMAAREEVRVKHHSSRLSTLPDAQLPQRVPSLATQSSTSSTKSHQLSHTPTRSSSLSQSQRGSQIANHRDHQFPRSPTHNGDTCTNSPSTSAKSSSEHSTYRKAPSSPRKSSRLPLRLDTPPESESESECEDRRRAFKFLNKKLPELPHGAPPTPSPSPELRLAPAPELRETKSIEILNQEVYEDIQRHLGEPFDEFPPLSRPLSPSSLSLSSSEVSLGSSTLREPDFTEFLNLSDDDIAESSVEPPILPYPEEVASIPSSYSPSIASRQAPSLLTLTPPCASRPATAAAFEAARIAKRYNFDLVYVVNLWPDQTRPQTSGPDHGDCASIASSFSARSSGMTGRLLAAYGLEKAKSPFQISSNVHKTILRSEGWIEYRNHLVRNDEFLRGYACAFYTGNYSRNDWARSSTSSSTLRSRADRGIVFAAYRMPRADGSYAGLNSDEGELADVYQDAETLVEMLIDIHVANRLRRPESISQQVDETGPMPGQQRMDME